MTDNEIIKALECCSNEGLLNCRYCPYDKHCDMGSVQMQVDVLNLINRQKAEIESLDKLVIEERKEIDRLYDYIQYTKSEAVKEFAEKLKKEALIDSGYEVLQLGAIDHIANEMVGE